MNIPNIKKEPIAVIFAGGEGKRLWPVSTKTLPKQLNTEFSKKTLVKEAFDRAATLFPKERIVIVTTEALVATIKKIIQLPEKNWIVQPDNADTAPAVCLTALHLETLFPESTAIIFYSDHKIANLVDFTQTIRDLQHIAPHYDALITIGTKPTEPNTQFGYIKLGKKQKEKHLYRVASFVEKPDEKTAIQYLKSKEYFWNTGLYAWHSGSLLEAIKQVAPTYYHDLIKLKIVIGSKHYQQAIKNWFKKVTHQSFDKAISEKLETMYVYVGGYTWEDVGNWQTVYKLAEKDKQKNVVLEKEEKQKIDFLNTSDSMVLSPAKHVALIGVKDLYVIQTEDALLICHKDHVADVKKIV